MKFKPGSLTRNSFYNLSGSALPLLVGLVTIPRLVHSLGINRFGILTLTWVVMGYFSLFDFGLGRALTQIVSERTEAKNIDDLPDIIRTALVMMLAFGILGGLCLMAISPLLVGKFLKLPLELHKEAYYAFTLMGISIPAINLLAGFRGILEARQHFFTTGMLRGGMGAWTFLGPWLVSFWTINLFWIVLSLEVMRYVALYAHYLICRRLVIETRIIGHFNSNHWKKMWRFGGWMTLSNVISPLMVNLDRFFIGGFISVASIAFYSTPYDLATKAFALSNAFVAVLFPMFGSLYRTDPAKVVYLYRKGIKLIFFILAPALLLLGAGAYYFFLHWLGPAFAESSTLPLRVLCFGVLINALSAVPYAYIQGAARPDLTAKFHLLEVPLYLICLWFMGSHYGIVGVAWAWTLRVSFDFILLLMTANRIQKKYHSISTSLNLDAPLM